MAGLKPRSIACLVCSLFAGVPASHAESEPQERVLAASGVRQPLSGDVAADVESAPPIRLRLERRFNVLGMPRPAGGQPEVGIAYPVTPRKDDAHPLFIFADRLEGRSEEVAEASGEVVLRRLGSLLFGERMTYRPLDDEVEASGDVRLLQAGEEMRAGHLRLQLSEKIGYAGQSDYHIVKQVASQFYAKPRMTVVSASSNASTSAPMMLNIPNSYGLPTAAPETRPSTATGRAERVEFEGENQIRLIDATYSTCKPGDRQWYLGASELQLDYDVDAGEARNAVLWFKDVPLFYTPIGTFPLNNVPRSGFLGPNASLSTRDGVSVVTPYYWSIAPNYDATIFPRYMSERGVQLGAEARYLDFNYRGIARAEYLPNDELRDRERWGYVFQHQHNLGRGVAANINWNKVSDDFFWQEVPTQDMPNLLRRTTQVQLPQQAMFSYAPLPWLQSTLNYQRFQTLQTDTANPVAVPYFLEPQLNVIGFKADVLHTDVAVIGQYSRFTISDPTRPQGDRAVIYPQLSLPFVHPAFIFTPKVGVHATHYSLNQPDLMLGNGTPESLSRTVPVVSLDSTVIFERETTLLDRGFIQTLEPRLYYVNIPYKDQGDIPVFDTALTDFNFAQIFAENRYSGFDRINDANQATAAVTTRMLDAETGVERFKALLGQRYYFRPSRVALPGETPPPEGLSNVIAAFNGLVLPKTYADAAWEYNYRESVNQRYSLGARFQPELGKVLSASYRFTRDPLSDIPQVKQFDIAGQWPLTAQLSLVGRYNYSIKDKQLLEGIAGFEYNAGCWALRVVGQRLEALDEPTTSVFVQLELTDFASVGSNPLQVLRRSIPGYGKFNELPVSNSMLMPQ
jgi:LPS-assembly protein